MGTGVPNLSSNITALSIQVSRLENQLTSIFKLINFLNWFYFINHLINTAAQNQIIVLQQQCHHSPDISALTTQIESQGSQLEGTKQQLISSIRL